MQAGSLEIGERLQTLSGDVKVVQQKLPRPGPQPVFNLEVHHEHVYFVGEDGVLVHNSCDDWNSFQNATKGKFESRAEAAIAWKVYKEAGRTNKTLVIGTMLDTEAAQSMGFQRLYLSKGWTPSVNDAWVQGAIDAGRSAKLVSRISRSTLKSPPRSAFPSTVFRRELHQLQDAGYRIKGGWAIPPSTQ